MPDLQVFVNDSNKTSKIYFEKIFQNKKIKWKCTPHRVTADTKLRIFRYKIFNNV